MDALYSGPPPMLFMRISVEGNIGAGKSSLLAKLSQRWPVYEEPVGAWQTILELFYAAPQRWSLAMNLQALASFTHIPDTDQVVITERSPTSCKEVFALLARDQGTMCEKEWQLFCDIYDKAAWSPDVIIYLSAPVTTSLHRIQQRARPGEENISQDYITKVQSAHNAMLRRFCGEKHVVDASQPAEAVCSRVTDILNAYTQS